MNRDQTRIIEAHRAARCAPAVGPCSCSTDYLLAGTTADLEAAASATKDLGIGVLRHHRSWCGLWDGKPCDCDETTDAADLIDWWATEAAKGRGRLEEASEGLVSTW